MTPVAWGDLDDLIAIKADPLVFALMLGGVRTKVRVIEELAEDLVFWGRTGLGIWAVRDAASGVFEGITGLMERPDGRGIALRFAFWVHVRGHGLAREAAGAALRFAHQRVPRVVAIARESNISSRLVLGGIGMRPYESFMRDGELMLTYESLIPTNG
jgi:RimJ/RimL family protein N-acetyltransferase